MKRKKVTNKNVTREYWMGYLQALFQYEVNEWALQYHKSYKVYPEEWDGYYDSGLTPMEAIKEDLSNY